MKRLIAFTGLLLLLATAAMPQTAQQTRLYGVASFFNDSLDQGKVTLTLSGKDYFYTSTQTVAAGQYVTHTNDSGYFAFPAIFGVDSLFPTGNATYSITIEQPELQIGGIVFHVSGLTINADGDSTDIRDVLAQ